MPGLSPIKIIGNMKFFANQLKLPTGKASGDAKGWSEKYYKDRDQEKGEMTGVPQCIPPWFMPQKPGYKYHQKTCDKIGSDFKDFHDAMVDSVQFAHNVWKLTAKFEGLQVMAVSAIGTPGCLKGDALESTIKGAPLCNTFTGNKGKHRDAVAAGVSKCFKKWQDKVMVPGLPWYPLFAALPSPTAPPTPNVPVPLIMCLSAMMTEIVMPSSMAKAMDDALDGGMKEKDPEKHYEKLHDAIATTLSLAFLMWLPSQQVTLVMGKGPVPSFAPPFVPVGPVVGGDNLGIPGHLMT